MWGCGVKDEDGSKFSASLGICARHPPVAGASGVGIGGDVYFFCFLPVIRHLTVFPNHGFYVSGCYY